jgi:phage gpG-like protein
MNPVPVAELRSEMIRLTSRLQNASLEGPLYAMLPSLRGGFLDNFNNAVGADGATWQKRKREGDGHPLLVESSALLQAVMGGDGSVTTIAARELQTGVNASSGGDGGVPFAGLHNAGNPATNLPQREFMYASEETLDRMVEVFADETLNTIFGD